MAKRWLSRRLTASFSIGPEKVIHGGTWHGGGATRRPCGYGGFRFEFGAASQAELATLKRRGGNGYRLLGQRSHSQPLRAGA